MTRGISSETRERLAICRDIALLGGSRHEAAETAGMTIAALETMLHRVCGTSKWPPVITDAMLAGERIDRTVTLRSDLVEAIVSEGRARADALRAERERWLTIEQQKYGLPKRGTHIDRMLA